MTAMTQRQRMLAVMAGQSPDSIPWAPRLEIWHEAHKRQGTLPEKYRDRELNDIYRDLDMVVQARDLDRRRVYREELRDVDVRVTRDGLDTRTEYITPVGTVTTLHRRAAILDDLGIQGLEVEHLIKGPDDYAPAEYMIEHTEIIPMYNEYLAYEAEIGEGGVPVVGAGNDPMTHFLQDLAGYNQAFYHLYDHPEKVEHLMGVLNDHAQKLQQVILDSPAKLILQGYHFDTMMTPPPLFKEHILPYYQPFAEKLRARGKTLTCHADADTSKLMELIKEAGFHMVECFVTAPMVKTTMADARAVFGNDVIIWGGIPSVMLCEPVTDEAFEAYMLDLFRTIAPGDAFILGVADNVMPEAIMDRVERVGELVAEYGTYPI